MYWTAHRHPLGSISITSICVDGRAPLCVRVRPPIVPIVSKHIHHARLLLTQHTLKKEKKKGAKDRWRKKRPSNSYNHLLVATLFRSLARLTSPATVLILPLSLSIPFVVYIFIADGSKGIYLRAFPFRRCLSVFIRVCLMNMYLCGGGSIASK